MGRRLIDADKLIELIDDDIVSLDKNMSREGYDVCLCTLEMVKQYIEALPTVELKPIEIDGEEYLTGADYNAYLKGYKDGKAEPIVRCKDCKYGFELRNGKFGCDYFDSKYPYADDYAEFNPEDFCSGGERKVEE